MVSGPGSVTPRSYHQQARNVQPPRTYAHPVTTPEILRSLPLVDEILESHRQRARGDEAGYDAYKAHVYRVVNFARALAPDEPDRDDKLAIAAAFHDLAAFDTLDYLVPSIEAQDAWLRETGRENWSDELALIVAEHHRLSRYGPTRAHASLVEAFRRADLVDVSQGRIRFGLPSSYVQEVRTAFDASIFFRRVIPSGTLRAIRKFQLPGFLLPRNALIRSGHEGIDR
jgi:HD domain-containing protein